ncbi:hypothetical protein BH09ACT10_BH09ACT10_02510 [soil metagenome]
MSYPPIPPSNPYAGGGYPAVPQTNKKALWSMITGILGLACCGPVGIVAIVLSTQGKSEIEMSGGQQTGLGLAKAGLILGILSCVFMVIGLVYLLGTQSL